ncbi:hypothetical protein BDW62DRAFT_208942 [Aspergillus aurantiobrunneus]
MSLNGLDSPTVIESYQIALTEAGGWFLLRYRGTGGVPDVRNAIENYEECSPLYGFLQYRRRKVVLSYLPEDLSRLVRARTTVQFQSVLDKFSPHDTVFSLSQPSELTESALSSACLLHTASGSITSSSSSLHAEESPTKDTGPTQAQPQEPRQRSFSQVSEATVVPPSVTSSVPQEPNGDAIGQSPSISAGQHSERPTSLRNFRDDLSIAPSESRQSTQSARPSLRDLERAAGIKPKVNGRPRTAENLARGDEQRPVASMPAGVRASSLRKTNPSLTRPRSQVPPLLVPPSSMPVTKPQVSPGVKSLKRLMKALQLRKSQMQKKAQEAKQAKTANEETSNATQDLNDDKENIGLHSEKQKYDKGRQRLSSISEHDSKGPPPNMQPKTQQPVTVEPAATIPSSDTSKKQPIVEMANDQSDYTLPSTTYSPADSESANLDKSPEAHIPPSEPETVTCGTGSPSAIVDEKEFVATPQPAEETPVTDESEVSVATEPTETVESQSAPSPKSPVSESRSKSVTDSSVTPANVVDQQNAPAPEAVNVEQQNATTRKDKQKPVLEPIQVPTPDYSDDDNLLSDDSFMEELKSATFEEAKPISVGKTPLSPGYSNGGNDPTESDAWRNSRAVSNPSAIGHQSSNASTITAGRSVSSPFSPAEPTAPLVAKKINVSSGISKRIKALEQLSSRDGPATPTPNASTPTAASFGALRKRASVSYGAGNSDVPLSRHSSYVPEPFSRTASLKRLDSGASTSAERPTNSVSVTARIIRDPTAPGNDSNTGAEPGALNLQASPLTVEHGTPDELPSQNPTSESTPNKTELRSMSVSSAGSAKPPVAALPRPEGRLSVSSRNDGYFSRSPSETEASSPEEKKESRTSRLLRRMSSITSPTRRSTISSRNAVVKEDSTPSVEEGFKNAVELPAPIDLGEVNVQFPDTLLWKRRVIRIDSKGFLVLTPGNMDSSKRNMVKRYHLTEFNTPCIPDEERQELSNSILLDFLDGSTLQFACESRQGQASVLQTLVNAHSSHQQLASK